MATWCALVAHAQSPHAKGGVETWHFDRLDRIGGYTVEKVGTPEVIAAPGGKAVHFNGKGDALIVANHPLAGASVWTWEVLMRPDADGAPEQRFFHLAEADAKTGEPTGNRMLFETRLQDGGWCLDSFAQNGEPKRTLLNCDKLHPLDRWYWVATVYDGRTLRNYVDGELQTEGALLMEPQKQGKSSVGVRINRVDWFKGSVAEARFTLRVLTPREFQKVAKQ